LSDEDSALRTQGIDLNSVPADKRTGGIEKVLAENDYSQLQGKRLRLKRHEMKVLPLLQKRSFVELGTFGG